jgi:hypothetical protein
VKNKILCLFLCLFLAGSATFATTVIPLSIEDLTQISSHVVEARALESWPQWNAAHTVIFTYTKFEVHRALKGEAPSTIVVRQIGGTLGGTTQRVSGVRHWKAGEHAVLFLRPGEIRDGSLVVTGLVQGNFMMYRGPAGENLVSNGAPETSAYRVSSAEVTGYKGSAMRLDEIEGRIQKAVQK